MKINLFRREFRLLRRLRSKKNRTFLVKNEIGFFVLKLFRAPHQRRAAMEFEVLEKAYRQKLAVPRPYAFIENKALLMEYIPGKNLCDLLNQYCLPQFADKLALWYHSFHRCFDRPDGTTLLRGDSNLRNFLIRPDGTLYGIDFEEAVPGDPAGDIGQICASILDTRPMFTPSKAALCRRLIARYSRAAGQNSLEHQSAAQIALALRKTSLRRPQQRRYLLKQAKLLEQKGLSFFFLGPAVTNTNNFFD